MDPPLDTPTPKDTRITRKTPISGHNFLILYNLNEASLVAQRHLQETIERPPE